jgi:hypothetical protein
MLTLGWAFSFLDRLQKPQGGLRASGQESGSVGVTGQFTAVLSARQRENVTTCSQTATYGQQTTDPAPLQPRAGPANPLSSSLLRLGPLGASIQSE